MPQLPQYERQVYPKAVDLPAIPLSFGQAETAAIGQIGEKLENTGFALAKEERDLKFISELADLHARATEQLTDLRRKTTSSSDFYTDPDMAAQGFAEQAKAMQEQYFSQIKDPKMLAVFKRQFGAEALTQINHVMDSAVTQRRANGEGLFYGSIARLGRVADNADTEDEAMKYIGQAEGYYNIMEKNGLIKPEAKVKELEKFKNDRAERRALVSIHADPVGAIKKINSGEGVFAFLRADRRTALAEYAVKEAEHRANIFRQDQERAEKERVKQSNMAAYDSLVNAFNLTDPDRGNFAGAVAFAEDPNNARALGLNSVEQVKEVSGMLETQRNQRRAAREEVLKQQNEKTNSQLLNLYNARNLTPDKIANSGLPEEKQAHWRAAVKAQSEDQDKTSPTVFNDAYTKILTGEYGSKMDIPLPGSGISGKDIAFLREEWDKAQDPTRSRYYTMLGDEFDRVFKDEPDMKAKKDEFLVVLAHEVRTRKLEGENIYKRGRELMKEQGRGIIDSFLSVVPGSGVPWTEPRKFEIDSFLNPPAEPPSSPELSPSAKTRPVPLNISIETRKKYEGVLRENNLPVTDANIKTLFDQDLKRGK